MFNAGEKVSFQGPDSISRLVMVDDDNTTKKKRKRVYGSFECDFPECSRVFTRGDHLSRHRKNHDPSKKLECPYTGCLQTFARNDIREKHYKRHVKNETGTPSTKGPKGHKSEVVLVKEIATAAGETLDNALRAVPEIYASGRANSGIGSRWMTEDGNLTGNSKGNSNGMAKSLNGIAEIREDNGPEGDGPKSSGTKHAPQLLPSLPLFYTSPSTHSNITSNGSSTPGMNPESFVFRLPGYSVPFSNHFHIPREEPMSSLRESIPQEHSVQISGEHARERYSLASGSITDHVEEPFGAFPRTRLLEENYHKQGDFRAHIEEGLGRELIAHIEQLSDRSLTSQLPNLSTQPVSPPAPPVPVASAPQLSGTISKPLSPSDLIEWLFHDDSLTIPIRSEYHHFPNDTSPMSSLLENVFATTPNFPHSSSRTSITAATRNCLIDLIPSLSVNSDFDLPQVERCLELYWLIYHPQYPILHRPSFSNAEAHPLLLLSMIMLGASLTLCSGKSEDLFSDPQQLAVSIAEPLRWLIFSNPNCKPPAKLYIVQSLLLLESFEITSTSRYLHERSFLYHGTKIQLLRRSPILGGDPQKIDVEEAPHVWKQWIEFESMKRACLMAFYLDAVHATVYGHTIILYAHQIKLSLPCEDKLWEFDNQQKLDPTSDFQSPKFLTALKSLLHRETVKTNAFGNSVLLAGLLTIMFQMQQKDLQLSFLEWNSIKETWNETISLAIDVWCSQTCARGCTDTLTAFYIGEGDRKLVPPMLRVDDKRCKFSLYHISQIYMRITHYDYIVYAGAPSRMNVKVTDTEYKNVKHRVLEWSNSINGGISVVHAYLFLFEMLLSPDNEDITYVYDPNSDPLLHRKNIVSSAVLVIFAYNYSLEGPESFVFDSLPGAFYPELEDGHAYLRRIRKELVKVSAGIFTKVQFKSSAEYHSVINLLAGNLPKILHKNRIAGLLKIFQRSFSNCNWEIGVEYSNLFQNCVERCLGRRSITCEDMYSVTSNTSEN